ncbi:NCS2 family permease [Atopobacter sp. AH10]|uniref:NCS2 family permease n=1 Tax=Atopobacter sp. AH10 TaxID=2315861 RepID=UPI000EF293B9|nr:NCS2 family permease [Atopobacter sp. AH10]RLK64179.1 NCS2 family permease [Atopobacter sp. AH10]
MKEFFELEKHKTTVATETLAGITTFFAMSYIIFVNPAILSLTGMPSQAVFLATILASFAGTLFMGLFANVPYALAPGMGLNAFFTFTVCFSLGFVWQEALAMVFICGIINVIITVTKIRKMIIKAIPTSIQHALGGGIGVFIAYIGMKNANLLTFLADSKAIKAVNNAPFDPSATVKGIQTVNINGGIVPSLVNFTEISSLVALAGLIITTILVLRQVKGAILLGIFLTTLLSIFTGIVDLSAVNWADNSLSSSIHQLGTTFLAAFGSKGMGALFSDAHRLPLVLLTIFAFSLSDTFDTLGTFIGTGRKTGIFSAQDERDMEEGTGFSSKMDKALFADSVGTSVGAIFGTSNTTTFVESAAGIGAGGRTGLTAVVTALLFLLSAILAPVVSIVPGIATAPSLIIVGVMMMSSFKEIDWTDLSEAIPCFFASIFMGLCYSISYGIAAGFFFYCLVKVIEGKAKEVHPIVWLTTFLFLINFVILAIL